MGNEFADASSSKDMNTFLPIVLFSNREFLVFTERWRLGGVVIWRRCRRHCANESRSGRLAAAEEMRSRGSAGNRYG